MKNINCSESEIVNFYSTENSGISLMHERHKYKLGLSSLGSTSEPNCRMNEEQFESKLFFFSNFFGEKRIFDQKSLLSETSPKLDCNPEIHRFTEKETIM